MFVPSNVHYGYIENSNINEIAFPVTFVLATSILFSLVDCDQELGLIIFQAIFKAFCNSFGHIHCKVERDHKDGYTIFFSVFLPCNSFKI